MINLRYYETLHGTHHLIGQSAFKPMFCPAVMTRASGKQIHVWTNTYAIAKETEAIDDIENMQLNCKIAPYILKLPRNNSGNCRWRNDSSHFLRFKEVVAMDLRNDSFFNFPDNHIYMRTKTKKVTTIIVASYAEFSGMEFETIQAGVKKCLQNLSNSASAVD